VESCIELWLSFNKTIYINNKVIYKRKVQVIPQIPITGAEFTVAISMKASSSME
jgi:hypothetical protein